MDMPMWIVFGNLFAFLFKAYFDYYIRRRKWLHSHMSMAEAVWALLTMASLPVLAVYKLIMLY